MKKFFPIWMVLSLMLCIFAAPYAAAGTIIHTYDNAGRLVKTDYGGGKTIEYTYDSNGNLLKRRIQASALQQYTLTVQVSPAGGGTVTGDGINCPGDCTQEYDDGTNVQLTANNGAAFLFLGWGGDLEGTTNPDTVTMNADKDVAAYFGSDTGDTDTDGVPDATECGPDGDNPSYDGDGNGIPDYLESRAASLNTSTGDAYATVAVPAGQTLANVQAVVNPSPGDAPAGVSFPYGFFEFTVNDVTPGDCTTVTIYLPKNSSITTYYKYGPTPGDPTDHWYEFMYDGQTGTQIFHEATQTRIVLHLCDGQRGDDDLIANGTIVDQGAPGIKQPATLATGTPSSYKVTVTKVEMWNGTSWVTIFSGTAQLDMKAEGTFSGISDLSLPAGTYTRIKVTFNNSFPVAGTLSYGGTAYYTTATTFGGQTNLASTPTTNPGSEEEFTFRIENWGALNADVVETYSITPVTVGPATDYQPTLRFTISDTLLFKGTAGTASTYYFSLGVPTVSIVEP